jgi:PAS domain S-box-containing protein
MRSGAHDYVMKDSLSRLCPAIARELEEAEVRNKQRQAENTLREGEEKYRTILENIEEGYYEVDIKGNFTFFNDSMCRILGYPQEEMMGMNNRQFTDKENAKKLFKTFNEVYRTGESTKEVDWQIIRKDGNKRYIEVSVSLQKNSSGQPIGFQGIARDITERKKVEESLKKSEEQYRLLADNITEHVWLMDLNTIKTIYVSPSVEKMYGYTSDEIIKLSLKKILTAESLQKMLDTFSTEMPKALANPLPYVHTYSLELQAFHKDGHLLWIENALSILRDKNGKPAFMLGETRDITDRKRAEKALQESEDRFRRISSITSDINYSCSTKEDGRFSINWMIGATERISGYSIEEIKAQRCWRFLVVDEDLALFEKNVIDLAPGSHGLCELRIRHKNGGIVWITSYAECLMATETPEHFILYGALVDITDRKRSEESLRQSEEKYRNILENMQEGYFELDLAGNYTFVNDAECRNIGYPKEELIGMNNRQYQDETNAQKMYQFFRRLFRTGEPVKALDVEIIRKNGTKNFNEVSVSLIRDAEGKPIGFRGISRDITERKRAEEALVKSEEKYRTILENIQEGYFEVDLSGNFTFFNDSLCRIIGYSKEELLGMNNRQYTDKETAKKIFQAFNKVYNTGEPTEGFDWQFIRKDGTKRYVDESVSLQKDSSGKPMGFRGIVRDATERKQAEETLKNSELKYRNIFENAIEGIYQSTIEGRFITANAALARMAGYDSPEELIESIKDIGNQLNVHPEDRERLIEIIEAKGFADGFEVEFYKKDGSKVWVVINARTVKDEQGKILYLEGLIEDITIRKHAEEQLQQTLDSLKNAVGATIQVMVSAVEARDPYTAGHQIRSADLARVIATEMGLCQDKIEGIRIAGSIHDIGKLSIPAEILSKPTKLTDIEFSLIKEHSQRGYEMLKNVESPWPLAQIVYQHHERMNGSGYPRNLKGDEIIMEARILAVADVVEAMASHRPYRAALGIDAALEEIEKNKGIIYDNAVANACLRLFREKNYKIP